MKDALLIHLDPDGTGAWCLATDHQGNGIGVPRHRALAELGTEAAGRRVAVLIPTERCTVLELRTPVRDRGQLLRALPALVEDRVASDVERLQLSAGPLADDGAVRVVAIEHAELARLLELLREAGLDPRHVVPDACCLPDSPQPTLAVLDGRVLLRAPQRIAALQPDAASLLLEVEPLASPTALIVAGEDAALAAMLRETLERRGVVVEERPVARHELERTLLRGLRGALAFDLRHGRHRQLAADGTRWRAWRLPLALAALWLALVLGGLGLELFTLLRERAALDAELAGLLQQVAPEAVGQPDPLPYLNNRIGAAGGGAGGASLDDVVRATGALRGVGGTELTVIDARGGVLELGVRASDLAALEAARGAVSRAVGRPVELRGATSDAGHAEARLALGTEGG